MAAAPRPDEQLLAQLSGVLPPVVESCASGRLIGDDAENVLYIDWNAADKPQTVVKEAPAGEYTVLRFDYGPGGERVAKTVETWDKTATTFYVRDPSGKLLATYKLVIDPGTTYTQAPEAAEGQQLLNDLAAHFRAKGAATNTEAQIARAAFIREIFGPAGLVTLAGPKARAAAAAAGNNDGAWWEDFPAWVDPDLDAGKYRESTRARMSAAAARLVDWGRLDALPALGGQLAPQPATVTLSLQEHVLYGSSRLGSDRRGGLAETLLLEEAGTLATRNPFTGGWFLFNFTPGPNAYDQQKNQLPVRQTHYLRGHKRYELSNHLGNVLATVSDKRVVTSTKSLADIHSLQDYYPFGMTMKGRSASLQVNGGTTELAFQIDVDASPGNYQGLDTYRFGFNGMESDDEWIEGGAVSYKYRVHDPRIGRFFSVDPLAAKYPYNSQYAFSENRVIDGFELEGLEYITARNAEKFRQAAGQKGENIITRGTVTYYKGEAYYDVGRHLQHNGITYTEWVYNDLGPVGPKWGFVHMGDEAYNFKGYGDCLKAADKSLDLSDGEENNSPRRSGARIQMTVRQGSSQIATPQSPHAIDLIQINLEKGRGVVAGVDNDATPEEVGTVEGYEPGNGDGLTDHYIYIMGRGYDDKGSYFKYYETARIDGNDKTEEFRLYINETSDGRIILNDPARETGGTTNPREPTRVTKVYENAD